MNKYIIEFTKGEDVKYVSHLDLIDIFARTLRRAKIKAVYSNGFNPHIEMTFASPLSVGVVGMSELVQIILQDEVIDLQNKLNEHLPKGFLVVSAKKIDGKNNFSSIKYAKYEIELSGNIDDKVSMFLQNDNIMMLKKTKSGEKTVDIKPFILDFSFNDNMIHTTLKCGEQNLKAELLVDAIKKYVPNVQIDTYRATRTGLYDEHLNKIRP